MSLLKRVKAKIKIGYVKKRNDFASENTVYPNVKWLSHHIPKTAGTSLYNSLEIAFGRDKILRAYHDFKQAKKLTAGRAIWVPKNTEIIHGHFRPHVNHIKQFPNAKRIVWLRDPLETNWSLLNDWLRMTDTPMYKYFYKTYLKGNNYDKAALFELMMKDENFYSRTRIFSSYLKNFKKEDFAFVGHIDNYNKDIVKLGELMNKTLKPFTKNVDAKKVEMPFDKLKYKETLKSEYDLLTQWI